jgi:hypothetical protein
MDEIPQNDAIRLEMSKQTKISCLAAAVAVLALITFLSWMATSRGRFSATQSAERVYTLAQVEDYAGLVRLVSKSAQLTLEKEVATNGKISSWKILKTETGLVGRPSTIYVQTIRNGKEYVDVAVSRDSMFLEVIVEYPKADYDSGREDHVVRVIAK